MYVLALVARLAIRVAGLHAELLLVLLAARVRRLHLHLEGGILERRNTSLWLAEEQNQRFNGRHLEQFGWRKAGKYTHTCKHTRTVV